jgi:hypothetical protein
MKTNTNGYSGHRFPREIISHGVWLYHRFSLSFRDVEEMLAKRGIIVTYETVRCEGSSQPVKQRFLSVHGVILNLFRYARHQMRSENYMMLRERPALDACGKN